MELIIKVLSLILGAIPIPADQPIMQIKDLDQVVIPTMELKVKINEYMASIFMNCFHLGGVLNNDVILRTCSLHLKRWIHLVTMTTW